MSFGSMVVKSPNTFLCDTFASARHHSEVAVHPGRSRWDRFCLGITQICLGNCFKYRG